MSLGLRNIDIKRVYGPTRGRNALREFLIPALQCSINYDRVAGYFSSGSLAQTAPGITNLVQRGGKVRLITSHHLVNEDLIALSVSNSNQESLYELAEEFETLVNEAGTSMELQMKGDYVRAMCWMLREEILEIRFVVPISNPNAKWEKFHSKFGILRDEDGDELVFSGSTNETSLGWSSNLENIDTKPLWLEAFSEFSEYKETFEDLWTGQNMTGWKTVNLPTALRERLIELAPEGDFPDILKWEHESQTTSTAYHRQPRNYQLEAVQAWEDSNHIGLLAMATGTGKTLTARLCIGAAEKKGSLLVVLVTPYQHISDQWVEELKDFNTYQVGAEGNWRAELQRLLYEAELGYFETLVVIAVKNTASSRRFVQQTNELAAPFENFLFIGDEVHWLGAQTFQAALNPEANFRLGLSATPKRYFDELGTAVIGKYFGEKPVFEFDLEQALTWRNPDTGELGVLTPYEYHPIFVELEDDEIAKWAELTQDIQFFMSKESRTIKEELILEGIRNNRADIAKSARAKIPALRKLLFELGPGLNQALIYSANHLQMEAAMAEAREVGIDTGARITAREGSKPSKHFNGISERQHILSKFAGGQHAVVFAIAALDEGVDIPSAEIGIILASSGNEKEFIQRRGRLMRKHPGKEKAQIFDFLVLPPEDKFESLRTKELSRAEEFAKLALNGSEALDEIRDVMGRLLDEQSS